MGDLEQLSLLTQEIDPDAFVVRESTRARHMSINVHPIVGVEVVVPRRTRPAQVEAFVRENRGWIARATRELAKLRGPVTAALPEQICLQAIGREWKVAYTNGESDRVRLGDDGAMLRLGGRTGDEAACRDALRRWLAAQGRRHLVPWLRRVGAETRLEYGKVQIRGQRTRWGSCSHLKTISLNYCLLFLAPETVRYLLIHELCHTRHLDHSRRYWALVERFEPDRRRMEAQLDHAWRHVPGWVLSH